MNIVNTFYLINKYEVVIENFRLWLIDRNSYDLIAVVSPYFNEKGTAVVASEVPL